jgi:hypothetical protein
MSETKLAWRDADKRVLREGPNHSTSRLQHPSLTRSRVLGRRCKVQMRLHYLVFMFSCWVPGATSPLNDAWAQDLSPRAYVITPQHSNAIILAYSFFMAVFSSMAQLR